MVTKYEIYKQKWTKKGINFQSIITILKKNLEIEEYVSTITIGKKQNSENGLKSTTY